MTAMKSTQGDSRISTNEVLEDINQNRRRFVGTAAMTIAAAQLGIFGSADAQPRKATTASTPSSNRGTSTSFVPLEQIDAALLNISYAESRLPSAPSCLLP